MKEVSVSATPRERVGRGSGRRTRATGDIPAVIYGPEVDPIAIAVNERGLRAALKDTGMSAIINLEVNGKTTKTVIREVQRDPVSSRAIHIDFHAISMTKPLHISVPIHFEGIPLGVKVDGGIMQVTMREMEISCLPSDIPEQILIDVEELGIGDSIHVKDLDVPNVKLLAEPQRTVVVISAPTIVKVDEPTEEELEGEEAAAAEGEGEGEAKTEGAAEGEKKEEKKDDKKDKKDDKKGS